MAIQPCLSGEHESFELHAAFRELYEETGIPPEAVRVVHVTPGWLHYEWPERTKQKKLQAGSANWKGQRQARLYVLNEVLLTLLRTQLSQMPCCHEGH